MTCLRCTYYRVGERVVFQCNDFEHCEMAAKIRDFGTNRDCVTCNKETYSETWAMPKRKDRKNATPCTTCGKQGVVFK